MYGAVHVAGADARLTFVDALRLGGLYFFGFHHVGIVVTSGAPLVSGSAPGIGFSTTFDVSIALLSVTSLAAFLLYRAGARLAAGGRSRTERVVLGAKVGVPYAVFSLLLSFVVATTEAARRIGVAHVSAFFLPLALGVAAGAAGAMLRSPPRHDEAVSAPVRRVEAAIAGGWRALCAGLALSFLGLLVLAAVKPDATRGYAEAVTRDATGAATFAHHVLVLPNQSMWVLAPAMGACDGMYGTVRLRPVRIDVLCYDHFPREQRIAVSPSDPFLPSGPSDLPFGEGAAPPLYFLFLLVPALATTLGGAFAATRVRARSLRAGAAAGASAGLVFAVLVWIGAWAAGVGVSVSSGVLGFGLRSSGTIGPRPATTLLFGLAWGVVGGAAGGVLNAARTATWPASQSLQREGPGSEEPGPPSI